MSPAELEAAEFLSPRDNYAFLLHLIGSGNTTDLIFFD